ncbi:uncharacterized protein [Nicotiana tomentosiformis]|uniref:uncharacterized protein n=1 Tax=Nicotiana tomentosiformis TaxID=4098 RepID=UPI00388CBA19
MEGPWAVCGDFNVTRFPSEKRNCNRRSRSMVEFSDFINDMNIIDLSLEGGVYTWFKGENQIISSIIDRILISEECDDSFRNVKQYLLQRLISDHVPVSLQCVLDSTLQTRALTEEESVKKTSLFKECEEHLKNEEIAWRKRSIALWLKEGDMNTSFFHKITNAHKRSHNIDQLVIQEEIIVEP